MLACFLLAGAVTAVAAQKPSLRDLIDKKKFAEVIRLSENFTAADSAKVEPVFYLGQAYEGLLKNRDAYRCYTFCLQKDSTNTDALNAVGRMAGQLGYTRKALDCFQRILNADSTDFFANYQMARLYMQEGNYEAAAFNFSYLLQFDKENAALWKMAGDCYSRMQTSDAAVLSLIAYVNAFRFNPENVTYGHLLANTLLPLGGDHAKEAVNVCVAALSYHPDNKLLQRDLGMAYYTVRQYARADSVFTGLLEQGDSTYLTLKYAGASRFKADMYMNAIDPLEKALDMDTASVEVNMLLGASLGMTYDRKRAFELLDKAEHYMQAPEDMTYQLALYRADVYERSRKLLDANRMYYEAYRIRPQKNPLFQMARLFYGYRGDSEEEAFRDRGLYNVVTLVKTILDDPKSDDRAASHYKRYLTTFREAMFYKGVKEHPMISPAGKKSTISIGELNVLITRIPDLPEPRRPQPNGEQPRPTAGDGQQK